MAYEVVFPSERVEREFEKDLGRIPHDYQRAIADAVRALGANPRPPGKRYKRLKGQIMVSHFIAQHRLRIGPYRILYDIDDQRKRVIVLKFVRRAERTYG